MKKNKVTFDFGFLEPGLVEQLAKQGYKVKERLIKEWGSPNDWIKQGIIQDIRALKQLGVGGVLKPYERKLVMNRIVNHINEVIIPV